jgi:hypothetical protein
MKIKQHQENFVKGHMYKKVKRDEIVRMRRGKHAGN